MPRIPASSRSPHFHFILPPSSFILLLLVSCSLFPPSSTPTPSVPPPTPTPAGPQTLNICLGDEPSSLYLYADNFASARAIRQAIYDGPFDLQSYAPQAVILESVPSLENGGIRRISVTAHQGDRIVDANGNVTALLPGVTLLPGNTTYSGGDVQLDQLVVTFKLKSGLLWSDSSPLTADDSVYSFELNASAEPPASHYLTDRTASYVASDAQTVVWTGLPGFSFPNAATNFWTPLPRHVWSSIAAADLLTNDASALKPMGWGPYVIDDWVAGQRISLSRNPNYWRASESLPYFSQLNFIFVGPDAAANLSALQSGTCDLLLPSAGLSPQDVSGASLQSYSLPADSWLHLDFGILPNSYDDGFNVFHDRADFFGDQRLRQAVAQCVDRQALIDQLAGGVGSIPNSYLPPGSPLYDASAANYSFDPTAANALLDQLGWVTGADGVRVNQTFTGALGGQRLELNLVTSDDPKYLAAAQIIKDSLDDCGIALKATSLPAEQAFATGPGSPIFGRNFDLALFAWPFGDQPSCYLYLGEAMPGADLTTHKYGWGGWNISGWQNADFDSACKTAQSKLAGEQAYADAEKQAAAIFAQEIPALPLYVPIEVIAARADFCGLNPQPGSNLLQDLENYGYAEWCQ